MNKPLKENSTKRFELDFLQNLESKTPLIDIVDYELGRHTYEKLLIGISSNI